MNDETNDDAARLAALTVGRVALPEEVARRTLAFADDLHSLITKHGFDAATVTLFSAQGCSSLATGQKIGDSERAFWQAKNLCDTLYQLIGLEVICSECMLLHQGDKKAAH